ncbi:MAG TPA: YbhB/YbcL family Raf kinase inhibitor-like protein [Capillimicrobium sp.]|nr:YbhB/YbcL family Raf kinase inhibitor-like protein [Capillimicrobium sp.]
MRLAGAIPAIAVLLVGCGGGDDRLQTEDLPRAAATLRVSSPAFDDGSRLPERFTCDGDGEEPPVRAAAVPRSARELVLVVSDPDAPGGTYVHLARYGIAPRRHASVTGGGREGRNSAGDDGWTAPCPPEGDGPHRYVWAVYALRSPSRLASGAAPSEVTGALRDGVLAGGTITARYER